MLSQEHYGNIEQDFVLIQCCLEPLLTCAMLSNKYEVNIDQDFFWPNRPKPA